MSSLGNRMKGYENVWQDKLVRRMPVIIRIDGKAFHSYTRGFDIFSDYIHEAMIETSKYLCENIQGCQLAYTQSDEINLLLVDYKRFNTEAWFDNKVQKMTSVSASYATMVFNSYMERELGISSVGDKALFDSRVFSLAKEEVCNYFIWRQRDAVRNSIRMLGRDYFSHKRMQNKSNSNVQDMLMEEYNINWNDLDVWKKRGSCVIEDEYTIYRISDDSKVDRTIWVEDRETPIFTKDRDYIDSRVYISEE